MAEWLLDTTVFRDYRMGDTGARAVMEQILEGEITASVSPLTILELWGVGGLDRKSEIGYAGLLAFLEEAPLSNEAAKTAGVWIAALDEQERTQLTRVALMAAIAKERGELICTRDAEPFGRFYAEVVGY